MGRESEQLKTWATADEIDLLKAYRRQPEGIKKSVRLILLLETPPGIPTRAQRAGFHIVRQSKGGAIC